LAGTDAVIVTPGLSYQRKQDRHFAIRPEWREDYEAVIAAIRDMPGGLTRVVHFWGAECMPKKDAFAQAQRMGLRSLLCLTQALANQLIVSAVQLDVVTSGLFDITGQEQLDPAKATVLGICKVIPQEYPNIIARTIDIGRSRTGAVRPAIVRGLLNELHSPPEDLAVGIRGNHRWVPIYKRKTLEATAAKRSCFSDGVVVITGGLGNVGMAIAERLAVEPKAKLLLAGRRIFPPREQWIDTIAKLPPEDPLGITLRKLTALEAAGAEIMVGAANIANREEVERLFTAAERRFGKISGIIHAAGVARHIPIRDTSWRDCQEMFEGKVQGACVLAEVLRHRKPDFCVMISSLASVLGGLGFAAYAAANAFLDGLAARQNRSTRNRWSSINWDAWSFNREPSDEGNGRSEAIIPLKGKDAFFRILCSRFETVCVSTTDLFGRIQKWIQLESIHRPNLQPRLTVHPRPTLTSAYVAPRNEVETVLALLWQELIGIDSPGVDDSFFELGGHSLLATQMLCPSPGSLKWLPSPARLLN
jgi:NAD(P)-dependent dehydrogenase (short-subunit alcohol dehydrogenase family)